MGKTVRKQQTSTSKRATSGNQGSKPLLLNRLLGLETEYAILRTPQSQSNLFNFPTFIDAVAAHVPVASSIRNDFRYFLANGGSFSLENGGSADFRHAFLEQATPECRSPLQLLESHQALQNIAVEAVAQTYPDNTVVLGQGNHDGHGHTYGQHESYDIHIASGLSLAGWRLGILCLMPMVLAYRILAAVWIFTILAVAKSLRWTSNLIQSIRQKEDLRNDIFQSGFEVPAVTPGWLVICARGLRILHAPIVYVLWCNIQLFALRRHRRMMTSFLASRCIIDGSGFVDSDGRFGVSSRGRYINSIIGFGGYGNARPLFRCDNWLRTLCLGSPLQLNGVRKLLHKRQRVEIAIGDSGLCHHAQIVRIGATALVLDVLERNPNANYPVLKSPVQSMRRFCKDWMLMAKESDREGRLWRAREIQAFYLGQVLELLDEEDNAPPEAKFIAHHWQAILRQLEHSDEANEPNRELVGRLDWVTKLWLLEQLDKDASVDSRRKLDLRYHELSEVGYGRKVLSVVQHAGILKNDLVERAMYNPPNEHPSQQRAYYIREFGSCDSNLKMDWDRIELQLTGNKSKTIHIRPHH